MAISNKFRELATANGRHVSCKITLGKTTYYDDRILKFEFHDVTHSEWFTIGTTCANEFSFSVLHTFEPELHEEVRPYISFDGEEWCPLGIFYVARRIIRGKRATFVCWDKMNDLDEEFLHPYSPTATISAKDALAHVCEEAGIVFNGTCINYSMPSPPRPVTRRNMIGYIAALNCACAKINRYGELVFKTYSAMPTAVLSADNCFNINRNITEAGISGIRVDTGTGIIRYRQGEGLTMVDLENPLMNQTRLNAIGKQLEQLYFYGAEIDMQGLPFLESGEFIQLKETDGTLAPIVMSEIIYYYDGALTTKLLSKNKEDSDATVHLREFRDEIAAIWSYLQTL